MADTPPAGSDPSAPSNSRPGLPVARLLPPLPASGPKPQPRPRTPAPPPPDGGFEVVEDETTPAATAGTADADFEVIDDASPRGRRKFAVVEDDDGDDAPRPRRKARRDEDDAGGDEDRPRKRKKKKFKIAEKSDEEADAERERENALMDWAVPSFLTILGLTMAVVGAVKGMGGVGVFAGVAACLGLTVVMVPVMIAALMMIGMMVGIEYGTLGSALRNLTAIICLIQGIMFLAIGLGLPCFVVYTVTPLITFGLFMTLFRLDVWETWITVTLLDAMQTAFTMLFFMVIIVALSKGVEKGMNADPDFGGKPGFDQRDNDPWQNPGGGRGGRPFDDDD